MSDEDFENNDVHPCLDQLNYSVDASVLVLVRKEVI